MVHFVKFAGKDKRDAILKAIDYFYDTKCDKKYSVFLAKCRIQNDHKTVHYYPDMKIKDKGSEKNETKSAPRHRWSFSRLLSWFRQFFKRKT